MSRFVLFLASGIRFITQAEVIAGMSMASGEDCGPVFAEGIEGDRYQVRIDAFDDTVQFRDRRSALNAIKHLNKDFPREESAFQVVCCDE